MLGCQWDQIRNLSTVSREVDFCRGSLRSARPSFLGSRGVQLPCLCSVQSQILPFHSENACVSPCFRAILSYNFLHKVVLPLKSTSELGRKAAVLFHVYTSIPPPPKKGAMPPKKKGNFPISR